MGSAFRRTTGGGVTATFQRGEVDLLRSLVTQLLELLSLDEESTADPTDPFANLTIEGPRERPRDPVLARLFPDAYADDPDAAADFRRFTERGLRGGKTSDAATVLESLEPTAPEKDRVRLRLNRDAAHAWMRTLTDLRLALGTRLGVEENDEARWAGLPLDDPRRYVHEVYDWLGWLQETLVRAVAGGRR
jgi:Domain of unknown function (DUF2017)